MAHPNSCQLCATCSSHAVQLLAVIGEREGQLPLLFAGGVMSNRIIAKKICDRLGECYFAKPAFSADNAAGIALLCRARDEK